MSKQEILIIDDEAQIRKLLTITLQADNYAVKEAATAKEGLIMAANHPPALILLDLGLPDLSGYDVLKQLRKWFTGPVIILSVQKAETDIILALDAGANDYIAKPFRSGELSARIRSALRMNVQEENAIAIVGELEVDLAGRTVKRNNTNIKLTSTEFALFSLLFRSRGKVLTQQFLLRSIWGPGYIDQTQYLRVFIAAIRKKIEPDPDRPVYLITEAGVGYRFVG